jgi:hypothetical protein
MLKYCCSEFIREFSDIKQNNDQKFQLPIAKKPHLSLSEAFASLLLLLGSVPLLLSTDVTLVSSGDEFPFSFVKVCLARDRLLNDRMDLGKKTGFEIKWFRHSSDISSPGPMNTSIYLK